MDAANASGPIWYGQQLNATNWTLVGASGVFLWLRVYCKLSRKRNLWWDDYFLIASWVLLIAQAAVATACVSHGLGAPEIPVDDVIPTFVLYNAATSILLAASAWAQTSFALTLMRLNGEKVRIFLWFAVASLNLAKAIAAIFLWVGCTPLQATWSPFEREGLRCWDFRIAIDYQVCTGAYSGAIDISLAVIPWLLIMKMHMRKREKVGIAIAMTMGYMAAITGFIRCSKIPTMLDSDFLNSYEGVALQSWGVGEASTTIMASSIPMLRVLLKQVASPDDDMCRPEGDNSTSQRRVDDFEMRFYDGSPEEGRSAVMFQNIGYAATVASKRKRRAERRSKRVSRKHVERRQTE